MRRRDLYASVALVGVTVLVLGLLVGFGGIVASFGGGPTKWTLAAERVPADQVAENLTVDLPPHEAAVATRAVENGSAETVGYTLPLERARRGEQPLRRAGRHVLPALGRVGRRAGGHAARRLVRGRERYRRGGPRPRIASRPGPAGRRAGAQGGHDTGGEGLRDRGVPADGVRLRAPV